MTYIVLSGASPDPAKPHRKSRKQSEALVALFKDPFFESLESDGQILLAATGFWHGTSAVRVRLGQCRTLYEADLVQGSDRRIHFKARNRFEGIPQGIKASAKFVAQFFGKVQRVGRSLPTFVVGLLPS